MKFKNHYNGGEFDRSYEKNNGRSMTVPDQALSVKDIMRRYSQGLSFGNLKVGEYQGEDVELPDFQKMDLSEIHEFKKWVSENLREKKEKITKSMEEKKRLKTIELYKKWKEAEKPDVVESDEKTES